MGLVWLWARFLRPLASILEGLGTTFSRSSNVFGMLIQSTPSKTPSSMPSMKPSRVCRTFCSKKPKTCREHAESQDACLQTSGWHILAASAKIFRNGFEGWAAIPPLGVLFESPANLQKIRLQNFGGRFGCWNIPVQISPTNTCEMYSLHYNNNSMESVVKTRLCRSF